jgi:hypothetical protein
MGINRYFGSNPKAFRLTGLFDQPVYKADSSSVGLNH